MFPVVPLRQLAQLSRLANVAGPGDQESAQINPRSTDWPISSKAL